MTKRDSIIAVLATFCLTATLFLVVPTRSTEGVPTSGYDPFADVSSPLIAGYPDNKIDTADVAFVAHAFGTEGVSTRNVTILNWGGSTDSGNVTIANWPLDQQGNLKISCQQGSPQVQKGSLAIVALDGPTAMYAGYSHGVFCFASNSDIPFAFEPKGYSCNVTDAWISFACDCYDSTSYRFDVTLNGNTNIPISEFPAFLDMQSLVSAHLNQIQYSAIREGINILTLSNPQYWTGGGWAYRAFGLTKALVYIEYEYQS